MKKLMCRFVILGGICLGLLLFCNSLFLPSRYTAITVDNYHWEHTGLQLLPQNSVDVIYVGSSHTFCAISPEDIFMEHGVTGYVLGSSCQRIWQSYYCMLEALDTQRPKCIVIDTAMFFDGTSNSEAFNREAIDPMKWSKAKLGAIKTAVEMNPEEDYLSYIFPVLRYHDRWESLEKGDWMKFVLSNHCSAKGYLPIIGTVAATFPEELYENNTPCEIPAVCREYLDKIVLECQQRDIKLILVKVPTCYTGFWDGSKSAAIEQYAEENSVAFWDYNANEQLRGEAGIDWSTESPDGGNHLNYDGAMKFTSVFADRLCSYVVFEDKRENNDYQNWITDYQYYKACINDYYIANAYYFTDWVERMNGDDMYFAACNAGDFLGMLTLEDSDALSVLGIDIENASTNLIVKDMTGQVHILPQKQITEAVYIDELRTKFEKGVWSSNWIVFYEGNKYQAYPSTLSFIVFDKTTGKMVDFVSFSPDETGKLRRV